MTYLAHASEQARQRHYEKLFIVDVDCHHYENANYRDIVEYVEDPILRHNVKASMTRRSGSTSPRSSVPSRRRPGRSS